MSKKIAVIGECMIELSQKGAEVSRGFGGDTLNTSVYIARQPPNSGWKARPPLPFAKNWRPSIIST